MSESVAVYTVSGPAFLTGCLTFLLLIAAGILLILAGRTLSRKKPQLPGLVFFACYAAAMVLVFRAMSGLPDLISALGTLLF